MIPRVSAIVLAAGFSRRMGFDKLTADFGGSPMISRVLELVAGYGFFERVFVTTEAILSRIEIPVGFSTVVNPDPSEGQSVSLRLGVSAAIGDAYLFLMGDQPFLTASIFDRLLENYSSGIRVPTIGGEPCSPVLFPATLRDELLALRGDTGGRALWQSRPELCEFISFDGLAPQFRDIDSPKDFRVF